MILAKEFEGELWVKASHHEREVKRAVEAEREACAKVCDNLKDSYDGNGETFTWCAHYIRARGQG